MLPMIYLSALKIEKIEMMIDARVVNVC